MTILADVKSALRISGTDNDTEITDLIAAAKADLQLAGVLTEYAIDTNTLVKRAIITYCKANYGWDNQEFERLQKSYDLLKTALTLSQDYNTASGD